MNTSQRVILILLVISFIVGVSTGNRLYYRLTYLWTILFVGSWIWSFLSVRGIRIARSARALLKVRHVCRVRGVWRPRVRAA